MTGKKWSWKLNLLMRTAAVLTIPVFILTGCLTVRLPQAKIKAGSTESKWTWESVAREALKNHPDLHAGKSNINSKARTRDIAFGDYLPSVSGGLQKDTRRTTTSPYRDSLSYDITAEESLFNGFETTGNVIKTKRDLAAEKWNYQITSADVRFRLRSAFVELLRLEKQREVSQKIEERRKKNSELIQLRYQAGREHLGSSLRAQAIADQAAFDVRQILRRLESQSLRFGRELGGNFEMPVQVEGDLEKMIPEMTEKPDFAALADQTPSVRKAVKNAEASKAALVSAQGALWPQVSGTASYGKSGAKTSLLRDESAVGVNVTMPFFNGGKNIGAIRKAKADYDAAFENARSTRDETLAQLAEAWAAWTDASEQVKVRANFLAAARKRSEIVRAQYETGLVNFQDFDIAEQDISDSEKNYVESLAGVLIGQAHWESVKGIPLEELV